MLIYALDDDSIMLETLEHCIREACPNAEIKTFENPKNLIEANSRNACDVAFLDILMPDMDGLELAKRLSETKKDTNIIFVTGYDEYMKDAFEMFASGFVSKPISIDKVRQQIENLRYPVTEEKHKRTFAKTFGNFTLLVDGESVNFARKKSLMLFAYLIHRNGTIVNKREMAEVLFEESEGGYDSNKQSYMSKLCSDIEKTLAQHGVSDIFHVTSHGMYVDPEKIDCDLYEYLEDRENSKYKYCGQYMEQYSFAEDMKAALENSLI